MMPQLPTHKYRYGVNTDVVVTKIVAFVYRIEIK